MSNHALGLEDIKEEILFKKANNYKLTEIPKGLVKKTDRNIFDFIQYIPVNVFCISILMG